MSALDVMANRHLSAGHHLLSVPVKSRISGSSIITNRTVVRDAQNRTVAILPSSYKRGSI